MKHEFKVTKSKDQTVYTLESASGGGTSSGSVASVSTALGGVQRRTSDTIFAQEEKKEAPKPRNFVAKNAKMGGAGKMKDKAKVIPRKEKHKKPLAEDHEIQMAGSELQSIAKNAVHLLDLIKRYSEQEGLDAWQQSKITKAADYLNSVLQSVSGEQSGMEETRNNYHANTTGFSRGPRDDERHDLDVPKQDPRETMMWNLTIDGNPLNPEPILGRSNLIKWGREQAASGVDLSNAIISSVKNVEEDAYMMELAAKLAEKIPPNANVDYYINDFSKSTAPQFKGKNPAKRKQMAIAAYYGSKQKKK